MMMALSKRFENEEGEVQKFGWISKSTNASRQVSPRSRLGLANLARPYTVKASHRGKGYLGQIIQV